MSPSCKTEKQNIPSDSFTVLIINYFLLSFFIFSLLLFPIVIEILNLKRKIDHYSIYLFFVNIIPYNRFSFPPQFSNGCKCK